VTPTTPLDRDSGMAPIAWTATYHQHDVWRLHDVRYLGDLEAQAAWSEFCQYCEQLQAQPAPAAKYISGKGYKEELTERLRTITLLKTDGFAICDRASRREGSDESAERSGTVPPDDADWDDERHKTHDSGKGSWLYDGAAGNAAPDRLAMSSSPLDLDCTSTAHLEEMCVGGPVEMMRARDREDPGMATAPSSGGRRKITLAALGRGGNRSGSGTWGSRDNVMTSSRDSVSATTTHAESPSAALVVLAANPCAAFNRARRWWTASTAATASPATSRRTARTLRARGSCNG